MLWVISVPYKREIYVHPHYIERFLQCMPYHHHFNYYVSVEHDIAVEEQDDLGDQTRWGS